MKRKYSLHSEYIPYKRVCINQISYRVPVDISLFY